jgi:hypothetical protein
VALTRHRRPIGNHHVDNARSGQWRATLNAGALVTTISNAHTSIGAKHIHTKTFGVSMFELGLGCREREEDGSGA